MSQEDQDPRRDGEGRETAWTLSPLARHIRRRYGTSPGVIRLAFRHPRGLARLPLLADFERRWRFVGDAAPTAAPAALLHLVSRTPQTGTTAAEVDLFVTAETPARNAGRPNAPPLERRVEAAPAPPATIRPREPVKRAARPPFAIPSAELGPAVVRRVASAAVPAAPAELPLGIPSAELGPTVVRRAAASAAALAAPAQLPLGIPSAELGPAIVRRAMSGPTSRRDEAEAAPPPLPAGLPLFPGRPSALLGMVSGRAKGTREIGAEVSWSGAVEALVSASARALPAGRTPRAVARPAAAIAGPSAPGDGAPQLHFLRATPARTRTRSTTGGSESAPPGPAGEGALAETSEPTGTVDETKPVERSALRPVGVEELTQEVLRRLTRRLAVEGERRGGGR